jgi:L,D-transpeptidase YcbB
MMGFMDLVSKRYARVVVSAMALCLFVTVPLSAQAEGTVANTSKVTTQTEVLSKTVSPMLMPDSAAKMSAIAEKYRAIVAEGGFPIVPRGTYKKGTTGKGVLALNRRLFLDGYLRKEGAEGEFASRVTSATIEAITRFQRNMGLVANGKMDGPTLSALNVPADVRLSTIEANIARLETYSQNLGDRYLIVNVPAQQIETVSNGRVYSRHNAIVGRKERPTPVVMTALSDINFNPYWNAPASIVEKDLLPKMKSGNQILADMNIRVFKGFGGPEVDPDDVDWDTVNPDEYHFRQEPGPASAMASAKINFPSPFGIYLHDTPEKQLFKTGNRFYSSGCVRVEKVDVLMEWILNGQEGLGSSEISALAETLERRDVKLEAPPQLRVTYLTAWPSGNSVAFRNDVYGLDGTGFVVGQPLPEGEFAEDGQRFVLKPIPRKAGAVDAAEAEGVGLFSKVVKPGKRKPVTSVDDNDGLADIGDAQKKKSPVALRKKPATASLFDDEIDPDFIAPAKRTESKKPAEKKKVTKSRDVPGLFDWAAYRKQQKQSSKPKLKTTEKPAKKKAIGKKAESEVAVAEPKKKVVADTKRVTADPKKAPVKKVAEACKAAPGKDCKPPAAAKKPETPN